MNFDFTSFVNWSAVFLISTITVAFFTTLYKLRFRWPIKANCWFCNRNVLIWRSQLDWWLCTFCEQYNGFKKDGDYRNEIPAQRRPNYNRLSYAVSGEKKLSNYNNSLCKNCNKKEQFKLLEIRNLETSDTISSPFEMQKSLQRLEEQYPLCKNCETNVQNILHKQSQWLAEYRMLFFKNRPVQTIVHNAQKLEKVFLVLLTICNVAISFKSTLWPSLFGGVFFQSMISLTSPAKRHLLDILMIPFWICMIELLMLPEIDVLQINLSNEYFAFEYITNYHIVNSLRIIIALKNVKLKPCITKTEISFKKMECPSTKSTVHGSNSSCEKIENETGIFQSPIDITDSPPISSMLQAPIPLKPKSFVQYRKASENLFNTKNISNLGTYTMPKNSSSHPVVLPKQWVPTIQENTRSLSTLSLADPTETSHQRSPGIFSPKIYSNAIPKLFKQRSPRRSFTLSPPKLNSMIEASWATNNYWQNRTETPTLSRSSSQSSGFGSVPSREPSFFDLDRISLGSEGTFCSQHLSRKDHGVPESSLNPFARPISCCSSIIERRNLENVASSDMMVIVTPVWLRVVFCVSIVLNIIFLCMFFLRP